MQRTPGARLTSERLTVCWSRPSTSGASLAGVRLLNTVVVHRQVLGVLSGSCRLFVFLSRRRTRALMSEAI